MNIKQKKAKGKEDKKVKNREIGNISKENGRDEEVDKRR